jgi:hypothetical protein
VAIFNQLAKLVGANADTRVSVVAVNNDGIPPEKLVGWRRWLRETQFISEAPWRADFIKEMAEFPIGQHDDVTDAFCHAMKSFTTERDFKAGDLSVMPGPVLSDEEQRQEDLREEVEYLNNSRIGDWGDDF